MNSRAFDKTHGMSRRELGKGDVFIFDLRIGSMENLFGLRPDWDQTMSELSP